MSELNEARQFAIAGWVAASSMDADERGNGQTIAENDLRIPDGAPRWLEEGIRASLGTDIGSVDIG